ncbi:FxSxx-COOH system tetratricopeptide repeat protein [Reticulibacter mediterranei]|nr:FxSxx-COOH system tetratricopeptide repeat protein [Reticulibacter mediterranei]
MAFPHAICIFCSYVLSDRRDKKLFDKLCSHLQAWKRQGVIEDVYDSGSGAGETLMSYIENYINKADIIVLMVSAEFFASACCYEIELKHALELSKADMVRLIPVKLRPFELAGSPLAPYRSLPLSGKPISEWPRIDAAMVDVVNGIWKAIEEVRTHVGTRARINPEKLPLYTVPYRQNRFFTGRDDELNALHTYFFAPSQPFQETRIQALSGLGGVGKTQLAVEYARRSKQKYQAILWLNASSRDIKAALRVLVDQLSLVVEEPIDEQKQMKAIKHWLRFQERWLLILDSLDDFSLIDQLVPNQGGHALLTVHYQSTGTFAHVFHVKPMDRQQGALFLLRRTGIIEEQAQLDAASRDDYAIAKSVAERLGGLPLVLDQAGAYIEETPLCDLAGYLTVYERERANLLNQRGKFSENHPESIMVTLSLAFAEVAQRCPDAIELLRLFAFLHPDSIPGEMFEQRAGVFEGALQKFATGVADWHDPFSALFDYSLVHRCSSSTTLSIHQIVQEVVIEQLSEELRLQWAYQAVRLVNSVFPAAEFSNWPICKTYLHQAQKCAELIEQFHFTQDEAAELLWHLGNYCYQQAMYSGAERYLTYVLQLYEQNMESNQLQIAETLNMLGLVYNEQGKYAVAEGIIQRVIEIREREQGVDHPDIAHAFNSLGLVYSELGKYQDAEICYQRVLSIYETAVDVNPLDVAVTLNNLAVLYDDQGKYKEAEEFYLRILAIEENALVENHPDLAITYNNLAIVYEEQGNYWQAKNMYQRALAIREQSCGEHDARTGQSLSNLAGIFALQKKYRKAEEYYQRALDIYRKTFSAEHPEVALVYTCLASLARLQRNYQQSEMYWRKALAINERMLGSEHPEMARVFNGLGRVYLLQERNADAISFLERALAIRTRALGLEHLDTAECQGLLAEGFVRQRRYEEAEQLFQQALHVYQQTSGQRDLDRVFIMEHYAQLLSRLNRTEEAVSLQRAARSLKRKHTQALRMLDRDE